MKLKKISFLWYIPFVIASACVAGIVNIASGGSPTLMYQTGTVVTIIWFAIFVKWK